MGILRDQGGAKFEGKWAVAPMPTAKSGTSFVGGGDLMVFKNSKNRDTAWKFVDYLHPGRAEQQLYQLVGSLPAVKSRLGHRRAGDRPLLKMFGTQLEDAKSAPAIADVGAGCGHARPRHRGSSHRRRRAATPRSRLRRARPTPSAPARADMSSVVLGDKPAPSRRRTGSPVRRREVLAAYCFAAPFFVLFLVFTVGPVISSFAMSFTDLTSRDVRHPLSVDPVGLDNYTKLLHDDTFHQAVLNTVYFVVVGVPLGMVLSLAAAVALNTGITRFRTFFRRLLLPAGRHQHRGDRGRLEVPARAGQRHRQHPARLRRHRRAVTGCRTTTGDAVADRDGRVAQPGLPDGHLPRRSADGARRNSSRRRRSTVPARGTASATSRSLPFGQRCCSVGSSRRSATCSSSRSRS